MLLRHIDPYLVFNYDQINVHDNLVERVQQHSKSASVFWFVATPQTLFNFPWWHRNLIIFKIEKWKLFMEIIPEGGLIRLGKIVLRTVVAKKLRIKLHLYDKPYY